MRFFHFVSFMAAVSLTLVAAAQEPWEEPGLRDIRPEGWHNWNNPANEKTAFYAESDCFGPGAAADGRVGWSHQLSPADTARYTWDSVMGPWVL